jgi:hypothetical protein
VIVDRKTSRLIRAYVSENIDSFHTNRTAKLRELSLNDLLRNKNPYLFRAKNLNYAGDLIKALLEARLSSSEEGSFGNFLEGLAKYVAEINGGATKSPGAGLDIDLVRGKVRYLIAVKSGRNWGNSSQHRALGLNFKTAVRVIKQDRRAGEVQPTLGICYGKFSTVNNGEYLHIGGQSFWHLISGDASLYIDLIEPLGFKAEEHNVAYEKQKANVCNGLTGQFIKAYCDPKSKAIDWDRLVRFVSENMPRTTSKSPK